MHLASIVSPGLRGVSDVPSGIADRLMAQTYERCSPIVSEPSRRSCCQSPARIAAAARRAVP